MYRRRHSGWIGAAAWAASTSKNRNKELPCLLMCPAGTGVLTRNLSYIRPDLLAALKPSRSSDDQHIGECPKRSHAGMPARKSQTTESALRATSPNLAR